MATSQKDLQLISLKDTISQLNTTIETLNKTIIDLQNQNQNLNAELAWFKQKMFGSSSERRAVGIEGQLSLFDTKEEEEKPTEIITPEVVSTKETPRRKKRSLKEQFENIPVRQVVVDTLSAEDKICPACGTEMVPIGTEVIRTEVIYHQPKLERIEYIATTYACPECKDSLDPQFIKDNGPEPFLPKSYLSESLLANIAYQKYGLYIPLYRQEKDFKALGASISRSTMASGLIRSGMLYLKPMFDFFHRKLLEREFLMMDETPVQVLSEEGRRPETKSYFWVVRTGEDGLPPIILFHYTPTRAGANAKEFLKGMQPGFYLMADGYQGYNVVKNMKRCTCYAHIRRYFLEAIPKDGEKDYTSPAVQGVLYCDKLFAYERTYKEKGLSFKQIKNRRQRDEKPIVEGFLAWAKQVNPGSNAKLKKALTYLKNREDYLMTYLDDGRCSFSNNLSENAIRPVTVGRKNWLFSESPEGAEANAIYLSIVAMAKAYGLNLFDYLQYVFEHRPNEKMSDDELEQFAPWNSEIQEVCKIHA